MKAIELDPVDEDAKEGIKDLIWACIDDEIEMEVHLDGRFKSLEEMLLECAAGWKKQRRECSYDERTRARNYLGLNKSRNGGGTPS